MSFTTGALLLKESVVVAILYRGLADWDAVRECVVGQNRLQMRTVNSSRRVCREVVSRLRQLTPEQFDLLLDGSPQDQRYILWLGVCKRYRFIYDFAVEVVREKYLRLDLDLAQVEYIRFFETKAEWHPEMDRIAPATRNKQRQFVFKMMREADLLSNDNQILPALLSPRVVEAIRGDAVEHFAVFPVPILESTR